MTRRQFSSQSAGLCLASMASAQVQQDPLPSWNNGEAKSAIVDFVHPTTTPGGVNFVQREDRIATFDQDGTLWVEHPIYAQVLFALDRVAELAPQHPEWKNQEPFKSVLLGDKAAMAKFTTKDLEAIVFTTHTGMTVQAFESLARDWTATAKDRRFDRLYTDLVYQPMLEVIRYLRANSYKIYIVT